MRSVESSNKLALLDEDIVLAAEDGGSVVGTRAIAGGVFNLLNTVLGGGISLTPLPFVILLVGPAIMTILMVVIGIATAITCWMLVRGSSISQQYTYDGLVMSQLGANGGKLTSILIIMNCFGVSITFLQVIADVFLPLLHISRWLFILIASSLLWFPCALLSDISTLQSASLLAIFFSLLFGLLVVERGVSAGGVFAPHQELTVDNVLNSISMITFSWACHFNVLPVLKELGSDPAVTKQQIGQRMSSIIWCSCMAAVTIYMTVAVCGFRYTGAGTSGDALSDYNNGSVESVSRVLVAIGLMLTHPLIVLEGLHNLHNMLGIASTTTSQHPSPERIKGIKYLCAFLFLGLSGLVAIYLTDSASLLGLVGAFGLVPIMFILPPLVLCCMDGRGDEEGRLKKEGAAATAVWWLLARVVLAFGVVVCGACSYVAIKSLH
jgi:amino acid permease